MELNLVFMNVIKFSFINCCGEYSLFIKVIFIFLVLMLWDFNLSEICWELKILY